MPVGVAGHRLVHGVVEHLGEEVVHRLLVGAADIHAGPPAHRLQPLQHLDVGGGIGVVAAPRDRALAAGLPGLMGFFFSSSSSLANRSRDVAALRMGRFDTSRLHESLCTGNTACSHASAAFSRATRKP